ncbi:hypothetical protein HYX17_02505 [Candidatus Woesearchaeota archaeon]|nr:hypothetical protein [Candidatus Woesearchaeota archaeon]
MIQARKIMIVVREPMSNEGLKHWSPKIRKKVYRYVFRSKGTFLIPYSELERRDKLAKWLYNKFGNGYFYLYIWRQGYYKKKERLRPYRIAIIDLKEGKNEVKYIPEYVELRRISKFSWFEPKKKQ